MKMRERDGEGGRNLKYLCNLKRRLVLGLWS